MSLIFYIFVILNAIIGERLLSWAWKSVSPLRAQDEKRDSQFPPFRRYDSKNWSKFRFYIGAVTWMPFRFMVGIFVLAFLFIFIK